MTTPKIECGFTLLEVLIALAILTIAMGAISHAVNSNIRHVQTMRNHLLSDWIAQNRLAIHQAQSDWIEVGTQTGEEKQASISFRWSEEISTTPNPTIRRILVSVYTADDPAHKSSELTGYLVRYPR